ncbi:hypothetical protein WA845_00215 [Agrobacterium sp. CMT1]|uniref:hypothetical protein n=1 Tax=Agrobacterium sp. CMT1 TaxID=3128901 RepID=UPI003076F162
MSNVVSLKKPDLLAERGWNKPENSECVIGFNRPLTQEEWQFFYETAQRTAFLMRGLKGEPEEQASRPRPCGIADPSTRDCQNMKEVGGGMDGERYRCDVCGKSYFLDYDEMK